MQKTLKEVGNFTIIKDQSKLNYLILLVAVLIGAASIYYSNLIVGSFFDTQKFAVC